MHDTSRFSGVLLACVFLSGCIPQGANVAITPAAEPPGVSMELTAAQRRAVEAGVLKSLKDPESARFGEIAAARTPDGAIYVCGFVNARNSFGGYSGSSPFIGLLATVAQATIFTPAAIESGRSASIVLEMCREKGARI